MKRILVVAFGIFLPLLLSCSKEEPIAQEEQMVSVVFNLGLQLDVESLTKAMPSLDVGEPEGAKGETDEGADPSPEVPSTGLAALCTNLEYIVYKESDGVRSYYKRSSFSEDEVNYGTIEDTFLPGDYTLVFIGHSDEFTLEADNEHATFLKVSDTFHKVLELKVEPGAGVITTAISLPRIVSRVEFRPTDIAPTGLTEFRMDVTNLYTRLNCLTGIARASASTVSFVETPFYDLADDPRHGFYTFMPAIGEVNKLSVELSAVDKTQIVSDIIPKRNQKIVYTGVLYNENTTGLLITVEGEWGEDDNHTIEPK